MDRWALLAWLWVAAVIAAWLAQFAGLAPLLLRTVAPW